MQYLAIKSYRSFRKLCTRCATQRHHISTNLLLLALAPLLPLALAAVGSGQGLSLLGLLLLRASNVVHFDSEADAWDRDVVLCAAGCGVGWFASLLPPARRRLSQRAPLMNPTHPQHSTNGSMARTFGAMVKE
eukprot:365661-Chlamydomonas_euryale.AAC.64